MQDLKAQLKQLDEAELQQLVIRLARFKKENKEFLSYILFMEADTRQYIKDVGLETEELFRQMKGNTLYQCMKSLRKVIRQLTKYIRFASNKVVETELLLLCCRCMQQHFGNIEDSVQLQRLYDRVWLRAEKALAALHEEKQSDYRAELKELRR